MIASRDEYPQSATAEYWKRECDHYRSMLAHVRDQRDAALESMTRWAWAAFSLACVAGVFFVLLVMPNAERHQPNSAICLKTEDRP